MLSGVAETNCYQEPVERTDSKESNQTKVLFAQRTVNRHEALKRIMEDNSIDTESKVYRACDPKYLDFKTMTVKGNPRSEAKVTDHYNEHYNPKHDELKKKLENGSITEEMFDFFKTIPSCKQFTNKIIYADELPPSLNVSVIKSKAYLKEGYTLISVKISDVLKNGGLIYEDVSCVLDINPLIVTIPNGKSIPFCEEKIFPLDFRDL
ncbi:AvrPphF family type III effector [Endozoicomonas sp. SCSIO W0465]|uniref:AvrPphF family type III effector n=1 Tax=Endozoicomonas sp. SCSIO W0465 TaxID=2918516 RepID=UPI0020757D0B|nr:AvrPphF family type III effector [Endozoicomonas sp. SCSIO W0465]USE36216.1 AvrPphF family type III effector [Endozoicomonas sp. SCSIO W0465]